MEKITTLIKSIDQKNLTGDQKKYFKLLQDIENLEKEKLDRYSFYQTLLKKFQNNVIPIFKTNAKLSYETAKLLHVTYSKLKVSNKTRQQCEDLIPMLMDKYFEFFPKDEASLDIMNTWRKENSFNYDYKAEERISVKNAIKDQFEIDIEDEDCDIDFQDPESLKSFFSKYAEQIRQKQEEKKENWNNRTKSKKEVIKEEKEKLDKRNIREIYIGLAKVLHPDKAKNDEERERNEPIMKLVTEAYENNDIITLMSLEVKYNKLSENDFLNLESGKVKSFIASLTSQKKILSQAIENVVNDPSFRSIRKYASYGTMSQSIKNLDYDIAALKKNADFLRQNNKVLSHINHKIDFLRYVEHLHNQFYDAFDMEESELPFGYEEEYSSKKKKRGSKKKR
jgi:hypothetical protein